MIKRRIIDKGEFFRLRFQKEIKGIEHGHFRDQIHLHTKFPRGLFKDQPRCVIGLRVLNPVEEVLLRLDFERVAKDAGP